MALWQRRNFAQLYGVTAQETTNLPLDLAGRVMPAVRAELLLTDRLLTQSAILQLSGLSVWCPVGFVQGNYPAC